MTITVYTSATQVTATVNETLANTITTLQGSLSTQQKSLEL